MIAANGTAWSILWGGRRLLRNLLESWSCPMKHRKVRDGKEEKGSDGATNSYDFVNMYLILHAPGTIHRIK